MGGVNGALAWLAARALQGGDMPAAVRPAVEAFAPVPPYRRTLALLHQRLGGQGLMAQSGAIADLGFTAGLHLVVTAPGPDALFERWQAIEAICGHTHRTRFLPAGPNARRIERWSLEPAPSTAAEDLFLLGAFAGAFREAGAAGVTIDPLGPNRYALAWTGFSRRPPHLRPLMLDRLPPVLGRQMATLADHPDRPWREPDFAATCGLSLRALQRHLAAADLSWPGFLRAARLRQASDRLLAEDTALTAIAHDAGFADQAHFTRSFRRAAGMSPSAYRRIAMGA